MKRLPRLGRQVSVINNIGRPLINIQQHQFSEIIQEEKLQEISNLDDIDELNPLLQVISQSETYQTVKSNENTTEKQSRYTKRIRQVSQSKQDRVFKSSQNFGPYAQLYEVSSVKELRELLSTYKQNYGPSQPKSRRNNIMSILEDITSNHATVSDIDGQTDDNSDDIKTTKLPQKLFLDEAYAKSIQICGFLKEFDEGFKLFNEAKLDPTCLNANVFGAAMWLTMEHKFDNDSLDECFNIFNDMKDNYNLKPSASVYKELISNSVNLGQIKRASEIVYEVLEKIDKSEKIRVLGGPHGKLLRQAIIHYFGKTKQIEKCLRFMTMLNEQFGNKVLDYAMYSSLLNSIAEVVKTDKSMLEVGEKVFEQAFQVLANGPSANQRVHVFQGMLNVYASVPDVYSCIDILNAMCEKDDWPNPNSYCFNRTLKALISYRVNKQLDTEEGWKLANQIIDLMEEINITKHVTTYALIFNLCGGAFCGKSNIDKLCKYYDEMKVNDVKPDRSSLTTLLMSVIDHYCMEITQNPQNKETIKNEMMKRIDWALNEFKKHNLTLPPNCETIIQNKLNNVV